MLTRWIIVAAVAIALFWLFGSYADTWGAPKLDYSKLN